jgi:hypothetical protein
MSFSIRAPIYGVSKSILRNAYTRKYVLYLLTLFITRKMDKYLDQCRKQEPNYSVVLWEEQLQDGAHSNWIAPSFILVC